MIIRDMTRQLFLFLTHHLRAPGLVQRSERRAHQGDEDEDSDIGEPCLTGVRPTRYRSEQTEGKTLNGWSVTPAATRIQRRGEARPIQLRWTRARKLFYSRSSSTVPYSPSMPHMVLVTRTGEPSDPAAPAHRPALPVRDR